MADVTHYARARKLLDDGAHLTVFERASLDALLAISTAQRETAAEVRYLYNRVGVALDEIREAVAPSSKTEATR